MTYLDRLRVQAYKTISARGDARQTSPLTGDRTFPFNGGMTSPFNRDSPFHQHLPSAFSVSAQAAAIGHEGVMSPSQHHTENPSRPRVALSVEHFCEQYGIGRTYAFGLIRAGKLLAVKAGKRTLIPAAEADRWFESLMAIEPKSSKAA